MPFVMKAYTKDGSILDTAMRQGIPIPLGEGLISNDQAEARARKILAGGHTSVVWWQSDDLVDTGDGVMVPNQVESISVC